MNLSVTLKMLLNLNGNRIELSWNEPLSSVLVEKGD